MPTQKIKSRKTFELLLWMMVICAATYTFAPSVSVEMNAITAIPVSFVMANYCAFTRRLVTYGDTVLAYGCNDCCCTTVAKLII